MTKLPRDLLRTAMFQDDVLTAGQLLDGGLTWGFVRSQVNRGHWQRLFRGVYATFSGRRTARPGSGRLCWPLGPTRC